MAFIVFFIVFIISWVLFLVAVLTRRSPAFNKFVYALVGANIVALVFLVLTGRLIR